MWYRLHSVCRSVRPELWDYAGDRLSEGPMEQVERHLSQCPACRREMEALRRAQSLLAICRQQTPPPRSDWATLRQRLLTEGEGSASPAPTLQRPRRVAGAWISHVRIVGLVAATLLVAAVSYRTLRIGQESAKLLSDGSAYPPYPTKVTKRTEPAVRPSSAEDLEKSTLRDIVAYLVSESGRQTGGTTIEVSRPAGHGHGDERMRLDGSSSGPASANGRPVAERGKKSNGKKVDPQVIHGNAIHFEGKNPPLDEAPAPPTNSSQRYASESFETVSRQVIGTLQPSSHDDDSIY